MEPLYLVDGSGYIFRAYYAIHKLTNSKGLPTNAIYGFTRMLIKLLRDEDAKYIAVTFDRPEPTFRHELYSEYKANRDECPEDLVPQMPYFRSVVEALGIKSLEKPGFEADDIIGTLARKLASEDQPVIIVSGDKDLAQLVTEQVVVWDGMRDTRFDSKEVERKFGVRPEQIVDFLALTGDSSDNIPGVKGVGPKTAAALISHFGSLDGLIKGVGGISEIEGLRGAKSVQKKIEENMDMLRISRELVTLDHEVEPFNNIVDVEDFAWSHADASLTVPLFEELEFQNLLESVPLDDPSAITSEGKAAKAVADRSYEIVSRESFTEFVKKLRAVDSFAFDTETSSLDILECELLGISVSWNDREAYYIPLGGEVERERHLDREHVRRELGPIFANPGIKKAGLNLKFDIGALEENGYTVLGCDFDAMLASYVINPDRRQHGLKALAKAHLKETMLTFEELVGEKEHIGHVELDKVGQYACHDADASWRLKGILLEKLKEESNEGEPSLLKVFDQVEMPLVRVLSKMERIGIKLDLDYLKSLEGSFEKDLEKLEARIKELAGVDFNLNSPKQLGEVLFDTMGISAAGIKKRKTGYSTDASVLHKLAANHEIAGQLLEYRELFKIKTTYIDSLQRLVKPKTARVHTSFNQSIAATGRLSSSDPNLQNIPIRTARGRMIREAFVADDGCELISADYSQIELRILAHLSEDENLKEAFRTGEDIHAKTAKELFGLASDEEEIKKLRRIAKTINFGIIYGMGAFRLARELGVSNKQAQNYIDEYFSRYPKVLGYFDRLKHDAQEKGYVETLYGRRRYMEDINSSGRDAGYLVRSIMNAPIQGSAAEVMKRAMICLDSTLESFAGGAKMVLQVHDELVLEVRKEHLAEVQDIVVREMEEAVELSVPIKVDLRVSKTWGGGSQ